MTSPTRAPPPPRTHPDHAHAADRDRRPPCATATTRSSRPRRIAFLAELHQRFARPPARPARRPHAPPLRDRQRPRPAVPRRHRAHPRGRGVARRRRRPGPRGPPRRDHRSDRPEDDDQRAELGREGLARRPGGRHEPHLEERHRGAAVAARRDPRRARFTSPEGKELRGHRRAHADDRDAPARLAPGRAAHPRSPTAPVARWRHRARSSTSGCTSSTTRSG